MTHLIWLIERIFKGQGFPCLFHLLTGLYCPGCGGTRAVRLLLRGDLAGSFCYHPFVPYLGFVLAAELLLAAGETVSGMLHKRNRTEIRCQCIRKLEQRYRWWTILGAGIVLLNWIVKNAFLLGGIDLLLPLN